MTFRNKTLAFVACLTLLSPARADFYTGNDLYKLLIDPNYYSQGVADGYIAGVVSIMRRGAKDEFCPPPGIKLGEYVDTVRTFLATYKEYTGNEYASTTVVASFIQKYPCQRRGSF